MQKLIKRRMRSYLHPTGMDVRGYLGETPPLPSGPPNPANTGIDQTHKTAISQVALDALKGAMYGAASGAPGGTSGMATGAAIGAGVKGAESIISNCVNCHMTKKN